MESHGKHTAHLRPYSRLVFTQENKHRIGLDLFLSCIKTLFHSSQKPTRKLAARTVIQSQYLKALAASLRVGFCDEWKSGFSHTAGPRKVENTSLFIIRVADHRFKLEQNLSIIYHLSIFLSGNRRSEKCIEMRNVTAVAKV